MKIILIILISLLFNPITAFATWEAKVVDVYDGDILIISDDGRARIIQLFGVDCPEKEQPYGLRATDCSRSMVVGKDISIVPVDVKRYQRCMVYVEGKCLNEELLKVGYAWHDKRYSPDEKWTKIEKEAVAKKKGLWSQEAPVPPWEFRGEKDDKNTVNRIHTIKLGGKHKKGTISVTRPPVKRKPRKR
jgi:endonuclease YncB( thermonuclease family)